MTVGQRLDAQPRTIEDFIFRLHVGISCFGFMSASTASLPAAALVGSWPEPNGRGSGSGLDCIADRSLTVAARKDGADRSLAVTVLLRSCAVVGLMLTCGGTLIEPIKAQQISERGQPEP